MTSQSTPIDVASEQLDRAVINTIKTLAIDAVQHANSGHPGLPMGAADFGYVLWTRFLKHDPADPEWPDRDRFVLSAGHGCMLLYSLLHLSGYELPLDELERFRQWGSRTPGHPEHGLTPGVEATTGPLGQGVGNAVGMALAERLLAARFNTVDPQLVDHFTYVLASDGDMMEGVASEAASFAGHLGLGKLVVFYDDNRITIEGKTEITFTEDVGKRYEAYGWHVQTIDGHDLEQITLAIETARAETRRPSLIIGHTHIAHGSPNKQDTAGAHGSPLGEEEVRLTKINLGWPEDATFYVPEPVLEFFADKQRDWAAARTEWKDRLAQIETSAPEIARAFERAIAGDLEHGWATDLPSFGSDESLATRAASGKVLQQLAKRLPNLIGGSADLAPSNNTHMENYADVGRGRFDGRNLHFGVREHAMGAILNGMALHRGFRVYGGTFLTFSDYMRPAIRLAAMTELPVTYVFTHDSIFLGEDGPTHQPIEQLAALRVIPNLCVVRPADPNETVEAWQVALRRRHGPTALVLTRQKLPVLDRSRARGDLSRGAYVLGDYGRRAACDLILMGSGSEVHLLVGAAERLAERDIAARVVSFPSWELFEAQDAAYRQSVLPDAVTARLAVEAACPMGWERYIGEHGRTLGIHRFGASAPYKVLADKFGFTADEIVRVASELVAR